MTCMTAFAETIAMATTQFTRRITCSAIQYQDAASRCLESNDERKPRLNWVVVTGNDGRPRLRMLWS
jgi:hypothetical protein